MRPVFSLRTGARILGDPRDIEPEREGLALVRAYAQAEASELVFRAALRNIVVAARRVVEHERPRAPGAADPRSEIRAVALEREPPADVARRLALVVAAHAVGAAHSELLAGNEQVFGLLRAQCSPQDEIRRQQLRERDTRAPDCVAGRSTGAQIGLIKGRLVTFVSPRNIARVRNVEGQIPADLRDSAAVGERGGPDRDVRNL